MSESKDLPAVTKRCPECGAPLVAREDELDGDVFLQCGHYPSCLYSEPLPESLRMRLAGHPPLF